MVFIRWCDTPLGRGAQRDHKLMRQLIIRQNVIDYKIVMIAKVSQEEGGGGLAGETRPRHGRNTTFLCGRSLAPKIPSALRRSDPKHPYID